MKRICVCVVSLLILTGQYAYSQESNSGGDGFTRKDQSGQCLDDKTRAIHLKDVFQARKDLVDAGQLVLANSPKAVSFEWPLNPSTQLPGKFQSSGASTLTHYDIYSISNFVDHNPATGALTDFECGDRTYDTDSGYDHRGTDYFSWPFDHFKSLHDQVEVVAAAEGVILRKFDGNADDSCSLNGNSWNAVYLGHPDGSVSWYGHLKKESLTSKPEGASVSQGEFLGVMASSGNSTGPHLHFEVYDSDSNLIDPYAGSCNPLNVNSWWTDQRSYWDSAINALGTHSDVPNFASCPQVETINDKDVFEPCELAYFMVYFRDQQEDQESVWRIKRPDGSIWRAWDYAARFTFYASWKWFRFDLPCDDELGTWTFEVDYEGKTYVHEFSVSDGQPVGVSEEFVARGFESSDIFPNPTNSNSKFELVPDFDGLITVNARNILGQKVGEIFRAQVFRNSSISIPVDLSGMVRGTYFVEVVGPTASELKKVVVLD